MLEQTPNEIFELALGFINHTKRDIFLTGKAGTGKTTFLKFLKNSTKKKFLIVAPSSIAAINAGGTTLHSLFQLPTSLHIPNINGIEHKSGTSKLSIQKTELLQSLDLLVIDEVSMLRADILDAIDDTLRTARHYSKEPFGGVQIMYIGDLFQLPPVLNNQELDVFSSYYKSPYFFDAKVIERAKPVLLELTKVYRQRDENFVAILNEVRNNSLSENNRAILNRQLVEASDPELKNVITITSHNSKADLINQQRLSEIDSTLYTFQGSTTGTFDEKNFQVARELKLKKDAKVIFMKNDSSPQKRYYNGQIGIVHKISAESIYIKVSEKPEAILLEKEKWQNTNYKLVDHKVVEEVSGEFQQYPIRLAWAITIHKSQGLTFETAVIDAKDSFSAGQVYVALSRLSNLEGLYLTDSLDRQTLKSNKEVIDFITSCNSNIELKDLLPLATTDYLNSILLSFYDWKNLVRTIKLIHRQFENWKVKNRYTQEIKIEAILAEIRRQADISLKFQIQLKNLLLNSAKLAYLKERIDASSDYFTKLIVGSTIPKLTELIKSATINKDQREFTDHCKKLDQIFALKLSELASAKVIIQKLYAQISPPEILDSLNTIETVKTTTHPTKPVTDKIKKSQIKTLELFRQGFDITTIATHRNLSMTTIEAHLAEFVLTGHIDVLNIINNEAMIVLGNLMDEGLTELIDLKIKVGDAYSFFELRCAINHRLYTNAI